MFQSIINSSINDNESKDRSLTEWNFSNPKKYMIESNSEVDVNDVELELFHSEKLPFRYGEYSHTIPEFQSQYKINDDKTISTAHFNNVSSSSFISSLSNKALKEIVPYHNQNKSITSQSTDQKAMTNPGNKENSSHFLNFECNVSNTFPKRSSPNSFNNYSKNNPVQIKSRSTNFSSLTNEDAFVNSESSQFDKVAQNQNCYIPVLQEPKNCYIPVLQEPRRENPKSQSIRKYHSTLNLNEQNMGTTMQASEQSSPSIISKSYSLSNLASNKTLSYDHIQSKVKKYIQDRKREELRTRRSSKASESKSLPVTPIKNKTNFKSKGLLDLDEEYLETLCIASRKQKEELPEDLKQIKQELLEGNTDPNLVKELFERLEMERACRINQGITLNALQLHYDSLLTKYAQAKNTIDDLKFMKNIENTNDKGCIGNTAKITNFKKAYSTSNLFTDYSLLEDENIKPSNLVRYSSSPLVDPDIANKLDNVELEGKSSNENSYALGKCSDSTFTINTSSPNVTEWLKMHNYLQLKIKEYIILERGSALNKNERETIWNFIVKIHTNLQNDLHLLDQQSATEYKCKEILKEVEVVLENVHQKYSSNLPNIKYHHSVDEKCFPLSRTEHANLPNNDLHPNTVYKNLTDFSSDSSRHVPTITVNYPDRKPKPSFLKYFNQRDGDSGCPVSDRSTRNSQFPSFDQSESLINAGGEGASQGVSFRKSLYNKEEDVMRRKSIDNFLNLSSINLETEENPRRRMYNRKELRYKSLQTFDEDYDASGSSELEDSSEEERGKKVRKKLSKSSRMSLEGHKKFEEKFICNHRARTTTSRSPRYESNVLGMSHLEKNSKYFEGQVKDLKLKGLVRKRLDRKRYSLPNRPNTPLKAITIDMRSLVNMSDFSISSTPGTPVLDKCPFEGNKGLSASLTDLNLRDPQPDIQESIGCMLCSCSIQSVPSCKNRKFSTSTPKSFNSEKTMIDSVDSGVYKEPPSGSFSCISADKIPIERSVTTPLLGEGLHEAKSREVGFNAEIHECHSCKDISMEQVECQRMCHYCLHSRSVQVNQNLSPKQTSKMPNELCPESPKVHNFVNEAIRLAVTARNQTRSNLHFFKTKIMPSVRR